MQMRYFNCQVKLGGDPVIVQTPRMHVSEMEVKLLRVIHGPDAVTGLQELQPEEVDKAEHMYQLARWYGSRELVEKTFNVTLDNFEGWLEQALIAEEQERDQKAQLRAIQEANRKRATLGRGEESVSAPASRPAGMSVGDVAAALRGDAQAEAGEESAPASDRRERTPVE